MATVITNPSDTRATENTGVGMVVAILLALALIALFFAYGLPALRGNQTGTTPQSGTNIQLQETPTNQTTPSPSNQGQSGAQGTSNPGSSGQNGGTGQPTTQNSSQSTSPSPQGQQTQPAY